jgi:hypothetical protein
MPEFGIALLPVALLPVHWQTFAAILDPEAETVWVVFWGGEIFGVYLSSPEAAGALASIEADVAANKKPKPQTIEQVRLQKRLHELKQAQEAKEAQEAQEAQQTKHTSDAGLKI